MKSKTRIKFTLHSIAKAQKEAHQEGRIYLWDTQLRGFGAYVTSSGVSWLIQKWQGGRGGKATRYAIGSTTSGMTLEQARTQARIDLGRVAKGEDVVAVRRERRRQLNKELNAPGLLAAFEQYMKAKSTGSRYWLELERNIKRVIAEIGDKTPVMAVTKADIRKVIDNKGGVKGPQTGLAAQRILFATLRPFFDWCVDQDLIAVSPMAKLKAPRPVKSRDRQLSAEEITVYWRATLQIPYPFGHYFRLVLLLAQRREEVGSIRIDEIDFDNRRWVIPGERTKNGKEHIVHLNEPALAVLKDAIRCRSLLPRGPNEPNVYYILTTTQLVPISGYSKAKTKLNKEMSKVIEGDKLLDGKGKLRHFRIHDLRRTFASHLASLGIPTDIADRSLNHISGSSVSGVKGVYQRYEFLPEREKAMAVWGEHVTRIVEPIAAPVQAEASPVEAAPGGAETAPAATPVVDSQSTEEAAKATPRRSPWSHRYKPWTSSARP